MHKDIDYLFSIKNYILLVTGLFILSLILGYLESAAHPETSGDFIQAFKDLGERIRAIEPPLLQILVLFLVIFLNNALKSLGIIIFGAVFGIVPLFFIAFNGQAIGTVVYLFAREKGVPYVLAALLPHGIIEIPVILVSAAIGVRIGYRAYISMKEGGADFKKGLSNAIRFYMRKIKMDLAPELKQGTEFYIRWLLPLLLLAAIVESTITPLILSLFK
jgi:stage II sporulation protein M